MNYLIIYLPDHQINCFRNDSDHKITTLVRSGWILIWSLQLPMKIAVFT
jgi:hypothetical protein